MRPYIPVEPNEFPEIINFHFDDGLFLLGFNYNDQYDSFTVDLYNADGEELIMGEPVILNKPLWSDYSDISLPTEPVIPMDEADIETDVSIDNLGITVQFYLDILDYDKNGRPIPDEGDDLIV
ncbi:phage baseplate plug family protein [Lentilactobacillus senioris]|uniref:phage baseplate plug family protein n=1 Tax=Lentilactobacillus senioris TaxID=931534 RepID=UPI003D2A2749